MEVGAICLGVSSLLPSPPPFPGVEKAQLLGACNFVLVEALSLQHPTPHFPVLWFNLKNGVGRGGERKGVILQSLLNLETQVPGGACRAGLWCDVSIWAGPQRTLSFLG